MSFKLHGFRSKKFVWDMAMLLWTEAIAQEGYTQEAMSAFTVVHTNMLPFFKSGWGRKQWGEVYRDVRADFMANVERRNEQAGFQF